MAFKREDRTKVKGLPDLLLPFSLVADGLMLQIDGSLTASYQFSGPDMASSGYDEVAALSNRISRVLQLGSGWMIQCDAIRSSAPGYPTGSCFPDAISALVDVERREQFERFGAHFESDYFLTITYLPPSAAAQKLFSWLMTGKRRTTPANEHILAFEKVLTQFESNVGGALRARRLKSLSVDGGNGWERVIDEQLSFWHRALTGKTHMVVRPEIPVDLADHLCSVDLVTGLHPVLGGKHMGVVAIDGYPKASWPGMLQALDSLAVEYRWNTRAILMNQLDSVGILSLQRAKWGGKKRGFGAQITGHETGRLDHDAARMENNSDAALADARSGDVQFAHFNATVMLLNESVERLNENVRRVMTTIEELGFSCRLEDLNAVEAWRGTLPGDGGSNIRRVLLHTGNIADMLPLTSVYAGEPFNPCRLYPPQSPPLMMAATNGATPFRFNLHVSDVAHSVVVGPTGAGKSTLLGALGIQHLRYPDARVFLFDRGYALWGMTQAVGGRHYDVLSEEGAMSFCPLAHIDTDSDLSWAAEWLAALCELNGLLPSPQQRNELHRALLLLRDSPSRTLTEFSANVQDIGIREALQHFTIRGALGQMLDAAQDSFSLTGAERVVCFETKALSKLSDKAFIPVMMYLFRRVEKMLDGSPALIIIDEAWAALNHPVFAGRLAEWLRELRKQNAGVVMATHQISDISSSRIADVIVDNCPTKIILPNSKARSDAARAVYKTLGLGERAIEIIAEAIPKRQYYVMTPLGSRLIDLGLGPVALAFVAVDGVEARRYIQDLMARYPESWREEYLRSRRLGLWADYLVKLQRGFRQQPEQPVPEEETTCETLLASA